MKPPSEPFQGSLFAEDFLREAIRELDDWRAIEDADLEELEADLRDIFDAFPTEQAPNESATEDDLIQPVLERLGWTESLRQQNLSARGHSDIPDGILFPDADAKKRALKVAEEYRRYEHGAAFVESKRWMRPLDRRSEQRSGESAPATQILRYVRRVDDVTGGQTRWGILTNGARWRLYYAGARSVSEQFLEIDLAAILHAPGSVFALSEEKRRHWLRVFALVFRPQAFARAQNQQTFHRRAIDQGRHYEERVASSLSNLVFEQVFPDIARALADAAPDAPLTEVRDAALVMLYRLLFLFQAEDRALLPIDDTRYENTYSLRKKVRWGIGRRKDQGDVFSKKAAGYWSAFDDLCRAIDTGDPLMGLPPYNGGLFDQDRTPLLSRIRLNDAVMADVVDVLSFEKTDDGRVYINYRNLGVQQLGSIYERLLEREVVREDGEVVVRPNIFARKDSGSYYTPDDLVGLVVRETLSPLVKDRIEAFQSAASQDASDRLERLDPAERLLDLKICDPAMGSGHFLVHLVDHLADCVIDAMAQAEETPGYISPLNERIERVRNTIRRNAKERGWKVIGQELDDRRIVRRMALKRCVFGVDKNPMAVELAKVSLWLHTFTVGAPLGFLNHHLRCGDSLFGAWVGSAIGKAEEKTALFLREPLRRATRAAAAMRQIERLADAEIAEVERSAEIFGEVSEKTAPLHGFLSLFQAFDWIGEAKARSDWLVGRFGNPLQVAQGDGSDVPDDDGFKALFLEAKQLVENERFLHWQVAFPGVWSEWEESERSGGFDAVIGNPPWDRMRFQQVEWFASRRPKIAMTQHTAERKRRIAELEDSEDPLTQDFAAAAERAKTAMRMARRSGDYPLLSRGDINFYALFVERAMNLVKPDGMVGLLVPSGIASDMTAAPFFKGVATGGRLKALYDFENGRPHHEKPPFFPEVHRSFKFCLFAASPGRKFGAAQCAFFLRDVSGIEDPERCFPMTAQDFARVNPNTGTAPVFRTRRDAKLTTAIYRRLPVLVDRSEGKEVKAWPVKYTRMFDMANDSGLFRTQDELKDKEGAWPVKGNCYDSPSGIWVPLYEGKMVQAFDHRAADIAVKAGNLFRPGQPDKVESSGKADPANLPTPRYWVRLDSTRWRWDDSWAVGFKDITASTNVRTMIAALVPQVGSGNTLPLLPMLDDDGDRAFLACLILANLNSLIFDYVARQKVPTTHLTWFILEQLPVVPKEAYERKFGPKTAAEIVREAVLELTYTAHDMAPFARDMGYVDKAGDVLPPFRWDADRRLHLRAKLDALYFHLYGVTRTNDIRYVYSTFPILEREELRDWGLHRSRDVCLAWMNALAAGDPDAQITL